MTVDKKFDLRESGFDDIIDSKIIINDTKYRIHSIIAEGGEKVIVALQNCETKLVHFAARIYKAKEGSKLYKRKKEFIFDDVGYLHFLAHEYKDKENFEELKLRIDSDIDEIRLEGISRIITLNQIGKDTNPYRGNKSERTYALSTIDNFIPIETGGALIQFQDAFDPFKFEDN